MIKIAFFSLFLVSVLGQQPQPQYQPQQLNPQNYPYNQPSLSSQVTPAPAPVHPPAQVHYVNIGQDLAGDYKFGYDTGKGPLGQSFREESRLPDGTVKGAYGYVDSNGQQRIVKYTAGKDGFHVDGDDPATPKANLAAVNPPRAQPAPQYNPAPQYQSYPAVAPALPRIPQPAPTAAPSYPQAASPYTGGNAALLAQQYRPSAVPALPQGNPQHNNPALQYLRYVNPTAAAQAAGGQPGLASLPQYRPAAPAAPTYQPRPIANQVQGTPLSAFPQLPGVRLIEINPRQAAGGPQYATNSLGAGTTSNVATNSFSHSLSSSANSFGAQPGTANTTPEPEYTGPVVINAALLSYDIGSQGRRQQR